MNYIKTFLAAIFLVVSQQTSSMFFSFSEIAAYEKQVSKELGYVPEDSQPEINISRTLSASDPLFNYASIQAYEKQINKINMREFFEQQMAKTQNEKPVHTKSTRSTQSIQTPSQRNQFKQKNENKRYSL